MSELREEDVDHATALAVEKAIRDDRILRRLDEIDDKMDGQDRKLDEHNRKLTLQNGRIGTIERERAKEAGEAKARAELLAAEARKKVSRKTFALTVTGIAATLLAGMLSGVHI